MWKTDETYTNIVGGIDNLIRALIVLRDFCGPGFPIYSLSHHTASLISVSLVCEQERSRVIFSTAFIKLDSSAAE